MRDSSMRDASPATSPDAGSDAGSDAGLGALEATTMRKVSLRIVPFVALCMFISYIDRVNIGFAALQMNKQLHFSPSMYGWGVSAFFITLCLCEVPSNMMMKKFGAKFWISRILITWGIISGCMALVAGFKSLVALRLLLGAAEAGFFPGIILYLTYWFPRAYRAKAMSIFILALPVSNFIGSPISGMLLQMEGTLGLHGWQWLFILEAVPAVLMGIVTLAWLPSRPENAAWLSAAESGWLRARLAAEQAAATASVAASAWRTVTHPRVLALALVYSGSVGCAYALSYWQPQMIKSFGLTNVQTGFLNAVPFAFAAIGMVIWAHRSDRVKERVWHTAIPLVVSAVGLTACLFLSTLAATLLALTVTLIGTYAVKAPMFALTAESLSDRSSAVGIGQVCALGNIAGLVCPLLIGWIKQASGSFTLGLAPMIALALAAAGTTLLIGRTNRRRDLARLPA